MLSDVDSPLPLTTVHSVLSLEYMALLYMCVLLATQARGHFTAHVGGHVISHPTSLARTARSESLGKVEGECGRDKGIPAAPTQA